MFVRVTPQPGLPSRRGSIMPALAIGLLVAGGFLALVLNQLWLSNAQEELRFVARSAALAAAGRLVSDDLLKPDADPLERSDVARAAAQEIAAESVVSGPVVPEVDVHLGSEVIDPITGAQQMLETDYSPTTVIVVAHRDRLHQNAVMLLAPYMTGRSHADVSALAEASISNLINGVRPVAAGNVPAWPISVLESSSDPQVQCWTTQIERRAGSDDYTWDPASRKVVAGPDGLPEMTLRPKSAGNLVIVNLGAGLSDDVLARQFQNGWSAADLSLLDGELSLQTGPRELPATHDFSGPPAMELERQIGQTRLFFVHAPAVDGAARVDVARLVAGRIMRVTWSSDGIEVVMQPAVVATRTALLDEDALIRGRTDGNPYIYKISLTQ